MRNKLWIVGLAVLIPAPSAAELNCPYLNAATAEGILGGAVTMSVAGIEDNGYCEFIRKDGHHSTLRIEVSTMKNPAVEFTSYAARCGRDGVPVHALGNEAVTCSVPNAAPGVSEQVVGRVRDRAFVVRIGAPAVAGDPSAERNAWRLKALKVAEQVAGNLF